MPRCDTCGNDYDKTFEVHRGTEHYVFDSFECAIQAMAPVCKHCGCRVIGHGVEADDDVFCCVHCAKEEGAVSLQDRV